MSKYSQAFFGKKDYYEIAPFRFPIYHDLVAGEAEGIEEVGRRQARNTYSLLKIARDLANKREIPVQDALDALSDASDNQDILFEYVDELADLQTKGQSIAEQRIETVSLFIQYRGEIKEKGKWLLLPDWSMDDTRTMPNRLLEEIYEFVEWERNGWPTDDGESGEEEQGN
jgi:hypothetical protein